MLQRVVITHAVFDRYIITKSNQPELAWTGAQWAEHANGVGFMAHISDFETVNEAVEYAIEHGFIPEAIKELKR